MLQKVFFSFCLFYSVNDLYVAGHCNQLNTSDAGNTSFEVRGLFQPCVRELSGKDKDGVNEGGEQGNDLTMKCSKKILVNLKITNQEPVRCYDHLILLDHVYDPLLNETSRLLNPVVIRVKQEQIIKLYDLTFLQLVNAEPKEVIPKKQNNLNKCKKPVSCGSNLKHPMEPFSNGICCSCDLKKMRHRAKCNKNSRVSCFHHQPGSLPYKDCVSRAHTSCINEDSYHSLQELPNSMPQLIGKNANGNLCNGKRVCHARPRMVKNDDLADELSNELSDDEIYSDDGNDSDYDGTRAVSDEINNGTFMGDKHFASKVEEHNKMAVYDNENAVENLSNSDETSSLPITSLVSEAESLLQGSRENMAGTHVSQVSENADVYSTDDVQLEEDDGDEILSGVGEDEIINDKLQETLKSGDSIDESFTNMDSRQKGVSDYPEENVEDDSEFHNLREQRSFSGSESVTDNGCHHGSSNIIMHCLKFSKLWYEVYHLSNSTYKHALSLQIFEKKINRGGSKIWVEMTQGKPVRLSSYGIANDNSYKYQVLEIQDEQLLLNPEIHRLLVPHTVEGLSKEKYPEASGKPAKFLILSEDLISNNGSECDKVGVSVKTFVKQKGRCTAKRGLCLKNQPSALWRMDKKKTKHGHKGQFFLENFGQLSKNPYIVDEISGNKILAQDFNGTHVSQADIVIPVSNNHVVRQGIPAQITSIVADATKPNHTILTVSVANLGLASAQFKVQLGKCIPNVMKEDHPSKPSHHRGNGSATRSNNLRMVAISPLRQADFTIDLSDKITHSKVSCIVEALNDKGSILAVRHVNIKNGGRCICLWHCRCDCMKTMVNIRCRLMTVHEVNAAGLKGTIPALLPLKPHGYLVVFQDEDSPHSSLFFLFGILLILLLLGLAKAILGATFWRSIWAWGLPYYCGPKQLMHYREAELVHREVNFDEGGYPIHPDTKKRTVQLYSRWIELVLNIFIFLVFPILALFWWPIGWCCSLCHRNVIGYRWIFSATKKSCSSNESSSEKTPTGTLSTTDPEDVVKSSSEGTSTSKCTSKTGSDGGDGKSNSSGKWKTKDQEEKDNKSTAGGGNNDCKIVEKNNSEKTSLHSTANSQIINDGTHPITESVPLQMGSKNPSSLGHLPSFESPLSIETYDGTADEQEINDVNYVLKQLHRSSTALQKSQERISFTGGPGNRVISISVRGEVVEDPEVSPRMESSSEDSVPGGLMVMAMGEKEKDFMTADHVVNDLNPASPLSNQVEHQPQEMHSIASSQGHILASPAIMEYSFQNSQMGPMVRPYENAERTLDEQTLGSASEVTTKDSLEVDQDEEGNTLMDQEMLRPIPEDVVKAVVEKLHAQRVVFRNIAHPVGEVEFLSNHPYCVRGYLLKTNGGYKFIPPTPLWQYWTLDADGINMQPLVPPKSLSPGDFEKDYASMYSVAEAGDLSECPLSTCINVQYQSFDSLVSPISQNKS